MAEGVGQPRAHPGPLAGVRERLGLARRLAAHADTSLCNRRFRLPLPLGSTQASLTARPQRRERRRRFS